MPKPPIIIHPIRRINKVWTPCTMDQAQAYDLRRRGSKVTLARCGKLARAKQVAKFLDAQRRVKAYQTELNSELAGRRYSDVKAAVAGKGPPVAQSLTEAEYAALHGDKS